MATTLTIRTAFEADRRAILSIVRDAFSTDGRDGGEELDIVNATWNRWETANDLELVALEGGAIVGHVLADYGELAGRPVVGVAPLAVAPSRQGTGIGTALMVELLERAEEAGLPLLVLLGSPEYYQRFGFEPSGPLRIHYRAVGEFNPHFQVRRLTRYDPSYRGDFSYSWEALSGVTEGGERT
jgi:predicted N-acetyltransferase YhbS